MRQKINIELVKLYYDTNENNIEKNNKHLYTDFLNTTYA